MPVTAKRIAGRWRVIEEKTGRITTNRAGTAVDGGGHTDQAKAKRQAGHINKAMREE